MNRKSYGGTLAASALGLAMWGSALETALAQVAGSTVLGIATTETSRAAIGWSARESILGRDVYNEAGEKVGKVEDLIVDRVRNVSFVIVGAGGFAGMGRHAVAIPASKMQVVGDRIVLAGATRKALAGLPPFIYAPITRSHSSIVERAERDVDMAKKRIVLLQAKSDAGPVAQREKLASQMADLVQGQNEVEERIAAMNAAETSGWKAAELQVGTAAARLRSLMNGPP